MTAIARICTSCTSYILNACEGSRPHITSCTSFKTPEPDQPGYGKFGTECYACGAAAETTGYVREDGDAVPLCHGCDEAHKHASSCPVF